MKYHKDLTGENLHQPFRIGNDADKPIPKVGDWYFAIDTDKLYKCVVAGQWEEQGSGNGVGDMLKSVYDTNGNGIVDKAETVDDGTNSATAADIKDSVDKRHTHSNKALLDTYDQTNADITDAVVKKHTAGTEILGGSLTGTVADARVASGNDADNPSSPEVGDIYIATDSDKVYKCITVGTWSLIKNLDLSGNKVSDLSDITSTGTDIDDAVAKKHNQQHSITSTADHTSSATPEKLLKADANGLPIEATNTDTEVADTVSKAHTQGTDTTLGVQTQDIDMGNHKVVNVADPVNDQDAATKYYVDAHAGGAGGTETDPVVGAVNGIVKADGNGNISAAKAGTDYLTTIEQDTSPKLGGNLDANNFSIGNLLSLKNGTNNYEVFAGSYPGSNIFEQAQNACNDISSTGGVVRLPAGSFSVAGTTLSIPENVIVKGAYQGTQITWTGDDNHKVAIQLTGAYAGLEDVQIISSRGSNWDLNDMWTGVQLLSAMQELRNINVRGFEQAYYLLGADKGCEYNNLFNCDGDYADYIGIKMDATGTGWVNENHFFGGRFNGYNNNGYGLLMDSQNSNEPNNNTFVGVSFEDFNIGCQVAGQLNNFVGIRTEASATDDIKMVNTSYGFQPRYNYWFGGYPVANVDLGENHERSMFFFTKDRRFIFLGRSLWGLYYTGIVTDYDSANNILELKQRDSTYADPVVARIKNDGSFYINKLGVANSASATTLGNVVKKIEIFDRDGNSLGFIPVYDSIT